MSQIPKLDTIAGAVLKTLSTKGGPDVVASSLWASSAAVVVVFRRPGCSMFPKTHGFSLEKFHLHKLNVRCMCERVVRVLISFPRLSLYIVLSVSGTVSIITYIAYLIPACHGVANLSMFVSVFVYRTFCGCDDASNSDITLVF